MTDKSKVVVQVEKDLEKSGVKPNQAEVKPDVLVILSDELLEDVSGGVHVDSGHIDVSVT